MKILITKSQAKLLSEQRMKAEKIINNGHSRVYPITNSFESGKFDILNTTEIDNAIEAISNEIKQFPENQNFTVNIESSESKVPNSGVGLKRGDLSKKRAETTQNYLKGKLPKNTQIKIENKGSQGPEWDPKKGSKDPEYTKYQYVVLELQGYGENTSLQTPKTYCEEKFESKGSFGNPSNGFISDIQKVDLGDGEGKIIMMYNPVNVPDIFVIEYNGKSKSTGLIGTDNEYYRLMIGTILGNYYKEREKPWWLKNLTYIPIDPSEAKKILVNYKEYVDPNDLKHVFPGVNVESTMFRKYKEVIPFILNPKQIIGYSGEAYSSSTWSASIDKIPEQRIVKIFVVGLIGQTKWSFNFSCDQ